ncbi:MAG: TRAP transporter substrate-binding protein DctP [Gammaproteobacteria bacterium]|nr:TRAP transporter substrate-binding protein DctP [Gammaproteobacteria bacterium]
MKRAIRFCLIALLFSSFSGQSIARTFKIATFAPAGTVWMKQMKKGAEIINEKTQGRVKFKYYPGGVMGNDASVHRKIRIGQLHGGAFTSGGLAGFYPDIQVLSLPMLFNSLDEVDYVRSKLDQVLKRNMENHGFVLLGIAEGGFARIMSKKPMADLKSIRASKVWIPEGDVVVLETYRTLGISPISLPISDVFTGLQTGLIETVSVNSTGAIAFQWHTSTAYLTDIPLIYLTGLLAIQKKTFDKISPEDQVIVREAIGDAFKTLDTLNRADNIQASEALKSLGIKFVKPGPEELKRWKTLSDQAIDSMIANGTVSREMVDLVMGYLSTYRNNQ